MDQAGFVASVKERHPELSEEIDALDDEANATLTAGALARHTQRAIDAGDRSAVQAAFATALAAWDGGDDRVQNSIGVSFLRRLNVTDGRTPRAWAWDLLHPRLQVQARTLGVSPSA